MYLGNKRMEISKKLILVMAGLSLGACSSTSERRPYMTFEDMQNKVHEHEEQWESVQPQLDRLEALELEVAALKAEKQALENTVVSSEESMPADGEVTMMTEKGTSDDSRMHEPSTMVDKTMSDDSMMHEEITMTDKKMSDTSMMHDKPVMEGKPEMAIDSMSNEPIPMTPMPIPDIEKTRYGVQVAAYLNHDAAENGWKILQGLEPQSFKGLDPLIHEAQVKGRTVHQVKVGPFFDKSFSIDFCMMLKEKGEDCFVTEYNGVAVTQ